MAIDTISIAIRALSLVAMLQSAGIVVFIACFGRQAGAAVAPIRRLGLWSAVLGLILVLTHHSLEAARMTGELSGLWDGALQSQVMHSSTGAATLMRAAALALIGMSLAGSDRRFRLAGVPGAIALGLAFLLTGHTSTHPQRWLLAPLLLVHLLIVAFWFGALPGLILVGRRETAVTTARVVASFTAIATWLVPVIAVAGLVMTFILLPSVTALRQPYGLLLLAKLGVFVVLMTLAALNKLRLGPSIAAGGASALRAFNRSVGLEYALIVCVLAITATLTALYSPEP